MYWMGALPARLHPDPQRALVICFGTGQTANALRQHVRGGVDVVEISRAVLAMAPHFGANQGVLDDPRVRAIAMDGRAWLRRSEQRYDVITLEPMPPNFAGVNSLYSKEFYEIVARRLEPGGVVAQWLPLHLVDPQHAVSIAATFVDVFPDAVLWVDPVGGTSILAGRRAGAAEAIGRIWPGPSNVPANRKLDDEAIRRSLLLDGASLAEYARAGTLVTDDNQMLQFSQLRAGLRGKRTLRLQRINNRILAEFARDPR
jgi:SAM-dependent methyltransferase